MPKIIGHTSPTPRIAGTNARNSLRTLAPAAARPSVRPPAGAPGMRGFPRARVAGPTGHANDSRIAAVSVTRALREQAEAAAKAEAMKDTLAALRTPAPRPRKRKPGPARPTVVGRPSTPDEQPLAYAPAAARLDEPPLRTAVARGEKAPVAHRSRRRVELGASANCRNGEPTTRPRPSRVLAELHAALADEAAAAE